MSAVPAGPGSGVSSRASVMTTPPSDPERTPTVTAFGDADDHLRLTVLLAGALQRFEPDAAAVCRQAEKNPWPQRLDALKGLLRAADTGAARVERPLVRVADVEALPWTAPGAERWDDGAFVFERSALRRACEALPSVVALDGVDAAEPDASVYDRFEPALRPIARHIVARRWVDEHSLEAYLRLGRPQHVLVVAWDWLRPATRDSATRLSALRPAQKLNGGFGPLALQDAIEHRVDEPTLASLDRGAIDELLDAGFLQRLPGRPNLLRFPPRVREFLRAHALVFSAESLRADHALIARLLPDEGDEAAIERHHHAVLAGDAKLALDTALFYGADLRAAAAAASLERRYDEAAEIFRVIVERFDPRDAYAWEYLGFNLWQRYRRSPQKMPHAVAVEARRALERACSVDARGASNPLFRGRLLGFRAVFKDDIGPEFTHWLRLFRAKSRRGPSAVSWFARQVRTALAAAGMERAYELLCEPWRGDDAVWGELWRHPTDSDARGE